MSARPAPVTGPTSWLASALIALITVCGVRALEPLLAPGPWATVSTVLVLVVAAAAAAARHYGGTRSGPSLWGLLTGVVLLAAVYSGQGSGPTVPMPTPDTLERLVRLGRSGILAISEGTVPLVPVRGVELLVVAGAVAAFLVADLVALTLGRAALSGLGLIALWVPAAVFERQPPLAVMLLAGTAFLLLLAVTRPQSRPDGVGREMAPALAAAAAVTVLAVVAGPVAAVTPAFGSVRLAGGWGGGGGAGSGPLRVSTELDMRSSLADRSDRPILRYTTTSSELGPLRLYTVVEFDGAEWQRSDEAGPLTDGDGVLWPAEVPADPGETDSVRVTVGDLDQDRLPIPINPRAIEIDGALRYDAERDEVLTSAGTSTRGAVYEMTVIPRALTADVLRSDVAGTAVDPALLEVPESPHGADIRATVAEVVSGATTTYDQAIALQSYFRSAGTFSYSTEVPPAQTDDAVWDFLTQRTGYCVQYATAMTLMARMIGIPARLAVGFLPGRADTEVTGEYVVTGRQAHAWPELYFEKAGWVRFEPTPAAQTGAPPAYADPFAALPFTPEEQVGGTAAPQAATPAPVAPGAGVGDGRVSIGSAEVPVGVVIGSTLLLLALLTALWWVRRRQRPVAVPDGPEAWWEALRVRLAEHGTTWSDAATVRQAALTIRERYAAEGLDAGESVQALERLVRAVEAERYAPAPAIPSAAELEQWVDLVERPWLRTEPKELVGV